MLDIQNTIFFFNLVETSSIDATATDLLRKLGELDDGIYGANIYAVLSESF